ncbi:MAG: chaperone modulator CbpM [Thiohalobacteraceae bacterium]
MAPHDPSPPSIESLYQQLELTLVEFCEACGVQTEYLLEMVEQGLVEPQGPTPAAWRFDASALERARTGLRLQRDLDLNLAGAALALDLLDELRVLRRRVALLERQLFEF